MKPATPNDPESRIRTALGLTRGSLPRVEKQWLRKYYEYLAANLFFPFATPYAGEIGRSQQSVPVVTVVALLHPDQTPSSEYDGLFCAAEIGTQRIELSLVDVEVEADHPNRQLLDDYWYWFWNWRFDPRI